MEKQNNISSVSYLLIFIILLLSVVIALFINNKYIISDNNNIVLINNISELNNRIMQLQQDIKLINSNTKLQDRLDKDLVEEFGNDTEFLNKVALLKKKIIKRKLESEVIKLENEKVARDNIENNSNYDNYYKDTSIARNLFDVLMINATNKSAVIQIKDDVISVKTGDNVRGFKIKDITADNVVVINPNGDEDRLTLNYLTKKIYEKKNEGEKNDE